MPLAGSTTVERSPPRQEVGPSSLPKIATASDKIQEAAINQREYEQMRAIRVALSVSRSPLGSPSGSPAPSRDPSLPRESSEPPTGSDHNAIVTRVRLEAEDRIQTEAVAALQQVVYDQSQP